MRRSSSTTDTDRALSRQLLDTIPHIMRAIRGTLRDVNAASLTVPQFRVLAFVSLQSCTNNQLADWQGVSLPAMSRMVDYLVRRHLLVRIPDRVDRRRVQLRLSKKGRAEFEALHRAVQFRLAERIMGLSAKQKASLAVGLNVLRKLFSEK